MSDRQKAKKQHNIIEQRRRNKEKKYYTDLYEMVSSSNTQRKPDNLTVLRMTSDHLEIILDTQKTSKNFLDDQQFKYFVSQVTEGFALVLDVPTGIILYVHERVKDFLGYEQNEWSNKPFFYFIHPNDFNKVKSQLTPDKKPMSHRTRKNSKKQVDNGLRRNFTCRFKHKSDNVYFTFQLNGYIKKFDSSQPCSSRGSNDEPEGVCLVASVCLRRESSTNDLIDNVEDEFVTRLDKNGRFIFVDPRVKSILGYEQSNLLNMPISDICLFEEQQFLIEKLKYIYDNKVKEPCEFRINMLSSSNFLPFMTIAYAFCNPCNDVFEFIVCRHKLLAQDTQQETATNYDLSINFYQSPIQGNQKIQETIISEANDNTILDLSSLFDENFDLKEFTIL